MTKVVAPTIANLISSWCRSKYGRIGRGSRAIVASVKDTTAQSTEIDSARVPRRSGGAPPVGTGRVTVMTPYCCATQPERAPVVTMIGGGQLARMTHQAAIALGQTLRVLAVAAGRPGRAGHPRRGDRFAHRPRRAAHARPTGADALTFDHEHVPTELLEKLVAEGVNVAPPPEALIHAQDKLVMRRRLEALGAPVPRFAAVTDVGRRRRVRRARRQRRSWSRRCVAATTAAACRWPATSPRRAMSRRRYLADGVAVLVEETGGDAARAGRAGGAVTVRAGRGVAGGGDRAARRHLRRGDRARARPGRRNRQRRRAARRCGWPTSSAWSGCWRSSCSRPSTARLLVNELAMRPHNSGHWTHGRRAHQSVRAAPARGAGLSARRHLADRAGHRDGQCAWRATSPAMSMDERLHHLFGRMPEAKVHLYGKDERPGRKIGHVNILGAPSGSLDDDAYVATCGNARAGRHTGCRTPSGPTDGMNMLMTPQPRVGVIMGSDSDWSVMEDAAHALAEFDVPFEVGVVSAHRTPGRMLDYAQHGRRPRHRGDHRRRRRCGAPARHGRLGDAAAGDRGAGAAGQARRPGLAAVDRADARRRAGGHGVDRRRPQRRAAGGAHPRRVAMPRCGKRIVEFQAAPGGRRCWRRTRRLRDRVLGG